MKTTSLVSGIVFLVLGLSGCDRQSGDDSAKISELEQKNQEAAERQAELEWALEDQKLAAERDLIARERMKLEEDREELERRAGESAAAEEAAIAEREKALIQRENKLEAVETSLGETAEELRSLGEKLSERDEELAGREALPFDQPVNQSAAVEYDLFYDSLSSYGSWFDTADYGYVWQPAAVQNADWRPYLQGHWVCSDRGWTWVSDEPFGWATYHYGRWALLRGRGWIWVPGTEWAPSWVSWRENDNHIGWAPLPPETLAYYGHNWDSTVDVQFSIDPLCYNFVEIENFGHPIQRYRLPGVRNINIFAETVNITFIHIENQQVICGGPKLSRVNDRSKRPLPFYRLDLDHQVRGSRDTANQTPRVNGKRLLISAPNVKAPRNEEVRPKKIKARLEEVVVERKGTLSPEISQRYRESRGKARQPKPAVAAEQGNEPKIGVRESQPGAEVVAPRPPSKSELQPDRPVRREQPRKGDPNGGPRYAPPVRGQTDPQPEPAPLPEQERPRREGRLKNEEPQINGSPAPRQVPTNPGRPPADPDQSRREENRQKRNQETQQAQQQQDDPRARGQRQRQREEDRGAEPERQNKNAEQERQQQERQRQNQDNQNRQQDQARQQQVQQEQARQQRDEARQKQEAQRQQQEEQRSQQLEAQQRKQQERQQQEAQQRQQQEAQRQQQQEAQQRQQEEAQRQQQEAQQRQQQEAEQRRAQESQRRQEQESQQRAQQEEARRSSEEARQRQQQADSTQRQAKEAENKREQEERRKNR